MFSAQENLGKRILHMNTIKQNEKHKNDSGKIYINQVIDQLSNMVHLIGHINVDLEYYGKDTMYPHVPALYQYFYDKSIMSSEYFLFGLDIQAKLNPLRGNAVFPISLKGSPGKLAAFCYKLIKTAAKIALL